MVCCFFGHRDAPESVRALLEDTIRRLIDSQGVDRFYVGSQGRFDRMAISALRRVKQACPHIEYCVVLAYMPEPGRPAEPEPTLYPDGLETVPPRFAISHRNRWMVKKSDVIVAYIARSGGGAAQFVDFARRQGKRIINLAEQGVGKR